MKDPRQTSNATRYSLKDAVLAAFSVFFMQSESFLDYQRYQESHQGNSNARSLFGMMSVPTAPQIRNILDGIPATALSGVFYCVYQALQRQGHLQPFQCLGGLLIALDGTRYFDSHKLHCEQCSSRKHKNGSITYFHSAILPVLQGHLGKLKSSHVPQNSSVLRMGVRNRIAKWRQRSAGSPLTQANFKDNL
jgi:hypothetical protein